MIKNMRLYKMLACLLACLLILTAVPVTAPVARAATSDFVTTNSSEFMLNGSRFYFAGTNNYYFHYKSQTMVDDVLADMVSMDLKVLRIWGFMDGAGQDGVVMQSSPGVFDESGFKKLDYAIHKAGQMGIKLVIPFTNNWDDFGGMNQYVAWFSAGSHDAFYTHPGIKQAYKDYITYMLNRVNTYTGVKYKDDPAIMTWELGNEPRAASDKTGNTLVQWADEMSAFIKSIDANHLVAVGDEGFYNDPSNPSYPYSGYEGVDWLRLISLPNIDYGTYHMYPDHWNTTADWGTQWIIDHIRDAKAVGKPAVLEEFGFKDQVSRNQVYQTWLNTVYEEGGAGSQFWILTGIQDDGTLYADYDGFRIVYPSTTATLISNHAAQMNAKSLPVTAPDQPTGVQAVEGHKSVQLTWNKATGAQSYKVKQATISGGTYITVASGLTTTGYNNIGLTNGTTYYYKVSAVNVIGESPDSAEVSAQPVAHPPGTFTLSGQAGDATVTLSWTGASGVAAYDVKRALSNAGPFQTVADGLTTTTYNDAPLTNGKAYYYTVTAVNEVGATDSNTVSLKPQGLVKVEYRAGDANAADNAMKPQLRIVNTGATPAALSDYKIHYWYTKGSSSQTEQFACEWAVVGCSNLSATFNSLQALVDGADHYVEISFSSGAGSLSAGANSGDLQLRVNLADWSNLNENDDYSYIGTQTSYALSEKVTLYRNGVLVWGMEPGDIINPTVPAAPTSLTATAGNAQAALSWNASSGATSYTVKRATTSGGPYTNVATVTTTGYTNTGLTNGMTYYYVVSASNSAGESTNSAQGSATPSGGTTTLDVVVQYKAADTIAADNQIKPHFNIKNNDATAVNLSDLKIRYYFTKDGSQSLNSYVDWAQVGSDNVQRTFVDASGTNTDTYLEISFASGAGSLAAGGQSGDIQLRMSKSDWSNFNESNDYSFDPTKTAFANWDRVTLYQNGTLVYGIEP